MLRRREKVRVVRPFIASGRAVALPGGQYALILMTEGLQTGQPELISIAGPFSREDLNAVIEATGPWPFGLSIDPMVTGDPAEEPDVEAEIRVMIEDHHGDDMVYVVVFRDGASIGRLPISRDLWDIMFHTHAAGGRPLPIAEGLIFDTKPPAKDV